MQDCGTCNECCFLLYVPGTNSKIAEWCKNCVGGPKGCKIYENRPEECRQYQCSWSQMENATIALRPDKCGVIFDKVNDKVMCGSTHRKKLDSIVKKQIDSFIREGISVVLINPKQKKPMIWTTNDYTAFRAWQDVREKAKRTIS